MNVKKKDKLEYDELSLTHLPNAVPEVSIEGGGGEDDLRETGGGPNGAIESDSMSVSDTV